MPRYVAFLRGINLGKRRPPMSRLRKLFSELGFEDVETFIASGNVLWSSPRRSVASLESEIARHLEKSLGYEVETFVRTGEQIIEIANAKPFPEKSREGVTIHVGFLHERLSAETARKLEKIRTDKDEFHVRDSEFFWLCRGRTVESEVWKLPELRALKLPTSTMRNLTSIRKLIAKHFA